MATTTSRPRLGQTSHEGRRRAVALVSLHDDIQISARRDAEIGLMV